MRERCLLPVSAADPTGNAVFSTKAEQDKPDAAEIHFKGITLKPGGFLAAEGVWRQTGETATVNSDFKAIPMPGASQSHLSDLEFTGRQSQLNLLAEGKTRRRPRPRLRRDRFPQLGRNFQRQPKQQLHPSHAPGMGTSGHRQRMGIHGRPDVEPGHRNQQGHRASHRGKAQDD